MGIAPANLLLESTSSNLRSVSKDPKEDMRVALLGFLPSGIS